MRVGVAHEPRLEHLVWTGPDARYQGARLEGGLLDFGVIILGIGRLPCDESRDADLDGRERGGGHASPGDGDSW